MSYLLDKKNKRKRFLQGAILALAVILFLYFRATAFKGISYVTQKFFHPVIVLGNSIGAKLHSSGAYFLSKSSLYKENQDLISKLNADDARMANYDSLLLEDNSLKEILNRKDAKNPMILAAILSKPNRSPYDTLLIDAGMSEGVKPGSTVYAEGAVPIGKISLAYDHSALVTLFSNPGITTEVVWMNNTVKGIFTELAGRGGGNFEMVIPKDLTVQKGDQVALPGIDPSVVAIVQNIISDPRDPTQKALLVSPVNVQNLKFVEVAK